jgi:cyclopropane fatty-acyl-phospholipid synthase-like methyltransferase
VDLLLEFGNGWGELSNEGMVEEYEIGEEVMTNKNTGFGP